MRGHFRISLTRSENSPGVPLPILFSTLKRSAAPAKRKTRRTVCRTVQEALPRALFRLLCLWGGGGHRLFAHGVTGSALPSLIFLNKSKRGMLCFDIFFYASAKLQHTYTYDFLVQLSELFMYRHAPTRTTRGAAKGTAAGSGEFFQILCFCVAKRKSRKSNAIK